MSLKWPEPGIKAVGQYQVSAVPFVTSTTLSAAETREISFPKFTKFIIVRNQDGADTLQVGFTQNGVQANPPANTNFIKLSAGESVSADLRIKSLLLSSSDGAPDFEVLAGLTDINANQFITLTGSNGFSGVG
jgi:hypothetical protein